MGDLDDTPLQYSFSVIMACYGTEPYIGEAIESLIHQTIGFEKHVELIIVNDGSRDNLASIALHYQRRYPENIIYIQQKNQGVGAARNAGLAYGPRGRYIHFMDSDDRLELNCLEEVYRGFSKKHKEQKNPTTTSRLALIFDIDRDNQIRRAQEQATKESLDASSSETTGVDGAERKESLSTPKETAVQLPEVVLVPIRSFGGEGIEYPCNKLFSKGIEEVDLTVRYDRPIMALSHAFFYASVVRDMRFHESLPNLEDTLFIAQVIQKQMKVVTLGTTAYWHRVVEDKGEKPLESYTFWQECNDLIEKVYTPLFNSYKQRGESVPRYFQYMALYGLWGKFSALGGAAAFRKYVHNRGALLVQYAQDVQRLLRSVQQEIIDAFDSRLSLDISWFSVSKGGQRLVLFRYLSATASSIQVEGEVIGEVSDLFFQNGTNRKSIPLTMVTVPDNSSLFQMTIPKYTFRVTLMLDEFVQSGQFLLKTELGEEPQVLYSAGKFSSLVPCLGGYFGRFSNRVVLFSQGTFAERSRGLISWYKREASIASQLKDTEGGASRRSWLMRLGYRLVKPFFSKEIWLFTDGVYGEDGSGELMYEYVRGEKRLGDPALTKVRPVFAAKRNSPAYKRLSSSGRVVDIESTTYQYYALLAEYHISSDPDASIMEPYKPNELTFRDIHKPKRIFIPPRIVQGDRAECIGREVRNFDIITSSGEMEFLNLQGSSYGYTDKQVKLTGAPRHDLLDAAYVPDKIIIIAPYCDPNYKREEAYIAAFAAHWNTLLGDRTLQETLRTRGYTMGVLCRSREMDSLVSRLDLSWEFMELLAIDREVASYQHMLQRGALFITDYSDIHFDAAYLRRPVLYYQKDNREGIPAHQVEEGVKPTCRLSNPHNFSYGKDGFGPVTTTVDALIQEVERAIERELPISPLAVYQQRADRFFTYRDHSNCSRLLREILDLRD